MTHRVNSVQTLHDDAYALYTNVVKGTENFSADGIINSLYDGIINLKNTWKGKDAGIQIQNVIKVYNSLVGIRDTLATLAAVTSQIAANYRAIQNANGAGLESFGVIVPDSRSILPDYVDTSDSISIIPEATEGKAKIDSASVEIERFIAQATKYYGNIMQNWTSGSGREELVLKFESFLSNSNNYKEALNSVSTSIKNSLSNYGL